MPLSDPLSILFLDHLYFFDFPWYFWIFLDRIPGKISATACFGQSGPGLRLSKAPGLSRDAGLRGTTEVLPFFYRSLQHELTRRSQLFEGFERFERADSSVSALGFSSNALEILWASTFVDLALPTKQLSPIWHALMRCSKAMCTTPSTALPQIAPMTPSVPISALCRELTCEPRVVLQLSDRILVPKADSLSSSFFGSLARGETFPLVHSNWVEPWATFKPTEDFWSLNHRVGRPLQICTVLAVCCKL